MGFADLKLTTPQQSLPSNGSEVHALYQELSRIFSEGISFTSRPDLITARLHKINRLQLSGDERYQLAYKLVYQVIAQLEDLRTRLSSAMIMELNRETCFAAKLLQRDCTAHSVDEKAQFAHWIIYSLAQQIRDHYESYSTEPRELWGELHRVYEFAINHRLTDLPCHPLNLTIDHSYKLAVLSAASEPHHFSPLENRVLSKWLTRWANKAIIHHQVSRNYIQSNLYVNLAVNEGVLGHQQLEQYSANDRSVMAINPLPVISLAREHLTYLKKGGQAKDLGINIKSDNVDLYVTLRKALNSWTKQSSRQSQREKCHEQVSLIIGLKQVHHFLRKNGTDSTKTIQGVALNSSQGGACIEIADVSDHNTNVGDLVFEQENQNVRRLAVVKWLKRSSNTLIFGIEYIMGRTQPVAISIKNKIVEALMVSSAQDDTLLTQTGLYSGGVPFYLKVPHQQRALAAVSGPLVNRHGRIDQFKIIRGSPD